ncbi:hypothetical protein ACIPRD_08815 [Streptomyces sp. NPDC090108]|uniref:hypothetical protein n=1 Tax=Streptomyces sp. NPDC090108 TaxID=3365947 RepID=UPI0038199554
MGRGLGRPAARVHFSSRLTWTFTARTTLGRAGAPHASQPGPPSVQVLRASAELLRCLVRAARAHPHAPVPHASRRRGSRFR